MFRVLVLAAFLLPSACRDAQPHRPPNLVLLLVDSLRADHLGTYGGARPISPNVDALARAGARFDRAYVTAPWTQPSVASLLTGLHPSAHGFTEHGRILSRELETLPERLLAAGYRTEGIVSHRLLSQRYQFDQGFERYDAEHGQGHEYVSTNGVTELALEAIDRLALGTDPFFLFVHYFDPHYRYHDHPSVDLAPSSAGRLNGERGMYALRQLLDSMTPEEVAFLEARYDEEIQVTDEGIGRLLDRLERAGVAHETLVVFTADHGEEFLAHGWLGHTRTLYEELIRVPLILRGPGVPAGRTIEGLVSQVSLAATLLELLGLADPEAPFARGSEGSFAHLLETDGPGAASVFAEVDFIDRKHQMKSVHLRAVVTDRWKHVHDLETGAEELFDLTADGNEQRDLSSAGGDVLGELRGELEDHLDALAGSAAPHAETQLSPEDLEELERLGYAGGGDE